MSSIQRLCVCGAIALSTGAYAFGLVFHASSSDSSHIQLADGMPLGFLTSVDDQGAGHFGSFVPIGEEWGIGALHTVIGINGHSYTNFRIGFGSNFLSHPGLTVVPDHIFFPPGYTSGDPTGSLLDMVLFHFPKQEGIVVANRYSGSLPLNSAVEMVGYGYSGPVGSTLQLTGDKRLATGKTESSSGYPGMLIQTFYPSGWSKYEINGGLMMNGDSGGGWYSLINGELRLVGVTTLKLGGDGYFAGNAAIPASQFNWVDPVIAAYSPEPSTCLLSGVGLLCVKRRKHA